MITRNITDVRMETFQLLDSEFMQVGKGSVNLVEGKNLEELELINQHLPELKKYIINQLKQKLDNDGAFFHLVPESLLTSYLHVTPLANTSELMDFLGWVLNDLIFEKNWTYLSARLYDVYGIEPAAAFAMLGSLTKDENDALGEFLAANRGCRFVVQCICGNDNLSAEILLMSLRNELKLEQYTSVLQYFISDLITLEYVSDLRNLSVVIRDQLGLTHGERVDILTSWTYPKIRVLPVLANYINISVTHFDNSTGTPNDEFRRELIKSILDNADPELDPARIGTRNILLLDSLVSDNFLNSQQRLSQQGHAITKPSMKAVEVSAEFINGMAESPIEIIVREHTDVVTNSLSSTIHDNFVYGALALAGVIGVLYGFKSFVNVYNYLFQTPEYLNNLFLFQIKSLPVLKQKIYFLTDDEISLYKVYIKSLTATNKEVTEKALNAYLLHVGGMPYKSPFNTQIINDMNAKVAITIEITTKMYSWTRTYILADLRSHVKSCTAAHSIVYDPDTLHPFLGNKDLTYKMYYGFPEGLQSLVNHVRLAINPTASREKLFSGKKSRALVTDERHTSGPSSVRQSAVLSC
jgi:hypothetical protein